MRRLVLIGLLGSAQGPGMPLAWATVTFDKRSSKEQREAIGNVLNVVFPVQALNETAASIALEEIIKQRHIVVEADGAAMLIPFDNIKYLQVYPAPAQMPRYAVRGATVTN